jgi:hypothetical protein
MRTQPIIFQIGKVSCATVGCARMNIWAYAYHQMNTCKYVVAIHHGTQDYVFVYIVARASLLLYSDFNGFYFCFMINGQFSILQLSLLGLQ